MRITSCNFFFFLRCVMRFRLHTREWTWHNIIFKKTNEIHVAYVRGTNSGNFKIFYSLTFSLVAEDDEKLSPSHSNVYNRVYKKNVFFKIQSAFGIWITNDKRNHFLKTKIFKMKLSFRSRQSKNFF